MHAVAVPQMTPEIALATVARFAQDRNDPQLTAIAADLAGAYGRGGASLQESATALNQYAYDNYHWGDRAMAVQLTPALNALLGAAGLSERSQIANIIDTRPPDQRGGPTPPAAVPPQRREPQAPAGDPHTEAMVRRMKWDRESRQRGLDALYADPNYARQLAGEPDDHLDEDYLRLRRTLFGKAAQ